jgi:glucose dehydrogenase
MPGAQTGGPMTYMLNGKQYLVVSVSGANVPGGVMAFTLPSER